MKQTTTYTLLSAKDEVIPKITHMGVFDDKDKVFKAIEDCGWNLDLCATVWDVRDEVVETGDGIDYIIIENKMNEINDFVIQEIEDDEVDDEKELDDEYIRRVNSLLE